MEERALANTMDDWLHLLDSPDYRWESREPPATELDINSLALYIGRPLPPDYVSFLRTSNGAALWYKDQWFLHLWRTGDIPSWSQAYGFTFQRIPGALVIGTDGGGESIVFDTRIDHRDGDYPLCAINFTSVDWNAAITLAPDFHSLLLRNTSLFGSTK